MHKARKCFVHCHFWGWAMARRSPVNMGNASGATDVPSRTTLKMIGALKRLIDENRKEINDIQKHTATLTSYVLELRQRAGLS